MRLLFLLALLIFNSANAYEGQISRALEATGKAVGKTTTNLYMQELCSRPDALRRSTECFKTPNGKRLYEYEQGVERNKWYIIAKEERMKIIREEIRQQQFEREQGKHAAERYKQDQTRCQFWRDQNDSPRRTEILENEC